MRLVILGSGTSFGVPVIGCSCEVCTSSDPRDHRTRVAAIVENDAGQRILIDTPPELRMQLVRAGIGRVNAVLYTHDHADHVHGIDDLRAVSVRDGPLPVFGPPDVLIRLEQRFSYIFDPDVPHPEGSSKPELAAVPIPAGDMLTIAEMEVLPLRFNHGSTTVYGYRIGPVAYLTDVKEASDEAINRLRGVEVLVVNALFERPHAAHLSIPEAISLAQAVGARRTLLTHLTHRYSHASLERRLPHGIEPAYDGLSIDLTEG
jgi:phosphoribosyl 1,2-cyclic phosphate phosphodiesterase